MICYKFNTLLFLALLSIVNVASVADAEPLQQSAQLKAGLYFPATKSFDVGSGFDVVYSVKPNPYYAVEGGLGYYRAENGTTGFLSAIPLTVSARAILPVQYVDLYAGAGLGTYYKMAGGITELPADHSEFSVGYHANIGFEFPSSSGLSLLLDAKYASVSQGKFKSYGIKHDGMFVYGGFALNF